MKNALIVLLGILAVALGVSCCRMDRRDEGKTVVVKQDLRYEENQLRSLAVALGCSQAKVSRMDLADLIAEVKSRILDSERSVSRQIQLSKNEIDIIELMLSDEDDTRRKINEMDKFIKSLRGKRILILSDDTDDASRY